MNISLINNEKAKARVGARTDSDFGSKHSKIAEQGVLVILLYGIMALLGVESLSDLLPEKVNSYKMFFQYVDILK